MGFENEKKKIGDRLTARATTGIEFINSFLANRTGTDVAWSRSLYLLLSYNFELMLKSRIVILSTAENLKCLNKELKQIGHSIKAMSEKLGSDELSSVGIKAICQNNKDDFIGYVVETDEGKIPIEDFINIRYDFMNDDLRDYPGDNEAEKIRAYIKILHTINSKIRTRNNIRENNL